MCLCAWVHSSSLPLLPGLIIVWQRALPFSIWYPWQHMKNRLRQSLNPTHSSLFPFPLHYSLLHHLPHFFPAFNLHFLHLQSYFEHLTLLLCTFCLPTLFLHFEEWLLALWFVPNSDSFMSWLKNLYTFTPVYWISMNWLIHLCVLYFSPVEQRQSRNNTELRN